MAEDLAWWQVAASLSLVALAIGMSLWLRLGVARSLLVAAARAMVQLIAVGYLITFIVESSSATVLSWLWVAAMLVVTALVARRRAPQVPNIGPVTFLAVGSATAVCLAVIFGLRVIEFAPVTLVVVAGITIGNTLPSVILTAKQVVESMGDGRGQAEALLALGFDARGVTRFVGGRVARTALIPQIERTNVVGLIALPGAMTGLLLAGVDPIDAVLVQVIVMYLVLGSVATAVIVSTTVGIRRSLTPDLRVRRFEQAG